MLCHGQLGDLHILRLQIAGHSCGAGQDDLSGAHTLSGHGFSIHRGALNIHLRHMADGNCAGFQNALAGNAPGVQRSVHDQRAVIDDVLAVQGLVMQGFPFGNIQVFHCDRSFFIMRLLSAGPVGPWPGRLCHPSGSWESAGAPFSW